MRHYPRSVKSRTDALLGPGHIGNHGAQDKQTALDRLKRYKPALVASDALAAYGGSA